MPTALAMAHALRKVLVMERKSGNLRTAGDMGGHKASLSPGVSVAPEKSLQLRACYRFWIVLIVRECFRYFRLVRNPFLNLCSGRSVGCILRNNHCFDVCRTSAFLAFECGLNNSSLSDLSMR